MDENLSRFSKQFDEKVAREKAHRLKLEFYHIDRKMKNIIHDIFISIVTSANSIQYIRNFEFSQRAFENSLK